MSKHIPSSNRTVLPQGALIEFIAQGAYVKVSAVDPVTYIEVSIVGSASAGEAVLTQQAVRKLERMVYKAKYDRNTHASDVDSVVPRAKRQETPSGWDL